MNLDQITLKGAAMLAGRLALRGDGEVLRAALGLAGGPLWLPGAAAATVTVEPDSGQDGASEEGGGEAAFTLHSPHLGAVEVRIRLDAGGVWAAVTTPPGPMTRRAAATLPDLVAGLERATGRTGIASVQARRGGGSGRCSRKVRTMATPEHVPDVVSPPPAAAAGVPVRNAPDAPPELYQAVAAALVLAYHLTGGEAPV
jgi:hypothetical protein